MPSVLRDNIYIHFQMLSYQSNQSEKALPRIAIAGLGGAGANILHCFAGQSNAGIALHVMALDERVGQAAGVGSFIQLGAESNHGFGSGGDPAVGAAAAQESEAALSEMLRSVDMLVLVAGLGGGTGSGAAPVIARLAREMGVFLVAVVTMPFSFEGQRRRKQAEQALSQLAVSANVLLCFENDHMGELVQRNRGVHEAFAEADQLLAKATASVPMIATSPGLINLGLDELKQALRSRNSRCVFGSGSARGVDRARRAAERAMESPLLAWRNALGHAGAVLVHIAGGDSLTLEEVRETMETVTARLSDEAEIFFGTAVKPRLNDEIRVTVLTSVDPEDLTEEVSVEDEEEAVTENDAPSEELAPEEDGTSQVTEEPVVADETEMPGEFAEESPFTEPEEKEIASPKSYEEESVVSPVIEEQEKPLPNKDVAPPVDDTETQRGKWVQTSFLEEEEYDLSEEGANEEPTTFQLVSEEPERQVPSAEQYEFDLDHIDEDVSDMGDDDLDVPPSMRSDKWNNIFPED